MLTSSPLVERDPWLGPHLPAILERRRHVRDMRRRIVGDKSLVDFAKGYEYFGLHQTKDGWVFREWLPSATQVFIIGKFSNWADDERFRLTHIENGVWEVLVPAGAISHGDHYKLHVYWDGGDGERIPAYARRVVQDPDTMVFDAQVWAPDQPYEWKTEYARDTSTSPYVYEAHIGMSTDRQAVTSYVQFTEEVLPRIVKAGYNTIQLMAIQEHPFYGSYGYHVSSLFAPSSRFGTPEEFKALIDEAHRMGLAVIMDIVHSHAVKNETEGLSRQDGTLSQYFHSGDRGEHVAWDSRLYDYGKSEVTHFLLSNCQYWLAEYRLDGFRFDGVTSMVYFDHGLEKAYTSYDDYFIGVDLDAVAYLSLANQLIHECTPSALTIAEEMSGMPGLAFPVEDDGVGFDYRLSMGVPDLWIKLIKEFTDEKWSVSMLLHELSQHRPEERTITYVESHDQALVGDKTVIFRLADAKMYDSMLASQQDAVINRAIALHKVIRLMTAGLHQGGYLNFIGNEFGHPEWIDFPREGNGWSYKYARRQWKLADDPKLKYHWLGDFDREMIGTLSEHGDDMRQAVSWTTVHDSDQVLGFMRGDLLFVFNLSPEKSYENYGLYAPDGEYRVVLSTDSSLYGGYDRIDTAMSYPTDGGDRPLKLYVPARTGMVLKRA